MPFATLLSIGFLGERIHWRRWLGIGMSFIGVGLIGFSPEVFHSWAGLLLIVVAAFIGAVGLVAIKRVHELEPLELQAWLAWGSVPLLLPLSLFLEDGQLQSLRTRRRHRLELRSCIRRGSRASSPIRRTSR